MKSRTIWHNKQQSWIGDVEIHNEPGDLLIESRYSMVSQGTERTMITEIISEETAQCMAVPHMLGRLDRDFTYGYSLVGQVIEGDKSYLGKHVHLMHPHQEMMAVQSSQVSIVPEDLDPQVATLASNLETAINAVWDGEIEIGDKVLLAGYGLIGALVASIIREIPGVLLEILETNEGRISLLKEHGFNGFEPEFNTDFDVVFNTTSSDKVLQKALSIIRQEGKVVELSWYGSRAVKLGLGSDFHYGRKQIISSQVSNIPHRKSATWNYAKRKKLVFDLLQKIDFSHLIGHVVPFDRAPDFFTTLRAGKVQEICTVIQY